MAQKVNIVLVGRNESDIIIQFMALIAKKGAKLVNIVSEYKEADMEVDITNYKGTTNLEAEVNYILSAAVVRGRMEKSQKKSVKIQKRMINQTKNKISKLNENNQ